MKHTSVTITLWVIGTLLAFSQTTSTATTTFNKSYASDAFHQNAIAILPHNNHYLVAGIYKGTNDYSAFYIRALDAWGTVIWEETVDEGQEHRSLSGGGSFIQTQDGNFVLAATKCQALTATGAVAQQSMLLLKMTGEGDLIWKGTIQQTHIQSTRQILETKEGNLAIVGFQKKEDGLTHAYITQVSNRGEMLWERQLRMGNKSVALSVENDADGTFLLSGYQITDETGTDMFVAKISKEGEWLWTETYGTAEHDTGASIKALTNGNFLLSGAVREQGIKKLYLSEINNYGKKVWEKIHAIPNIANIQTCLQLTSNGGFTGVAYYQNDNNKTNPIALFFDVNGALVRQQVIEGQAESNTYIKDMEATQDGGYILAGFNYNQQTAWVLKTDALAATCGELNCQSGANEVFTDIGDELEEMANKFQIAPNPIREQATISYELPSNVSSAELWIFNSTGQLAQKLPLNTHTSKGTTYVSAADFDSGMYVYQLMIGEEVAKVGRFVVE